MIFRNGVEIKKVNSELAEMAAILNIIIDPNIKADVLQYALDNFDSKAKRVADYLDRTDKVWVNRNKFQAVKNDFDALVEKFNGAKISLATRSINERDFNLPSFDAIDSKLVGIDANVTAKSNYLNNPNNYRTKDRIHFAVTRGTVTLLVAAAMIGGSLAIKSYKDKADSLTVAVGDLEKENDSLRGINDSLKGENDSLKNKNDSLKNENDSLKVNKDILIEQNVAFLKQIASLKTEKDKLQKQLENAQPGQVEDLKKQIADKDKQISDLGSQLQVANEKIAKKEEERKALEDKVTDLNKDITDLKTENKRLRDELYQQHTMIVEKDERIQFYVNTIAELEARIKKLEDELEDARNNGGKEKIAELEAKLKAANSQYATLESEYNSLYTDYQGLVGKYENLSKELKAEQEKNEQLEKANEELKKLANAVDTVYKSCYADDGNNIDAVEKLNKIVVYYTANYGEAAELREFLVSFIANVKGVPYESIRNMSVSQIISEASEILDMLQQPSENPDPNVKEDETKKEDETGKEEEPNPSDPDPISPDLPIRE